MVHSKHENNIKRLKWNLWLKLSYSELKEILNKSDEYEDKQFILLAKKPLGNIKMKLMIIFLILSICFYFQFPSYSYSIFSVLPLSVFLSLFVINFTKYLFLPKEISNYTFLGCFRVYSYLNNILLIYSFLLAGIITPVYSKYQKNTDKLHFFIITNFAILSITTIILLIINGILLFKKEYLNMLLICELITLIVDLRRWYNYLASDIPVPVPGFLMIAILVSLMCTNGFVGKYRSSLK